MVRYKVELRYSDTDQMGLIYFSRHFIYADEAFMRALKDVGIDILKLESEGIYMAVVAAHCEYKSPLRYGMECEVDVKVSKIGETSVVFEFAIYGNGVLTSNGYIVYVFVNREGSKVKIPDEIKKCLAKLQS